MVGVECPKCGECREFNSGDPKFDAEEAQDWLDYHECEGEEDSSGE